MEKKEELLSVIKVWSQTPLDMGPSVYYHILFIQHES